MSTSNEKPYLYVFLDEAGNFDFSRNGTRFFIIGCISKTRPFQAFNELIELKYDLVEKGVDLEYFHAAEDQQATRNEVFEIIQRNLMDVRYDAIVVEKRKTGPALQKPEKFYPRMLGYLLKHVLDQHEIDHFEEVIVFTDKIPVQKKKKSIEKGVKEILARMLPGSVRYRIYHHESKSNQDLQIADYFNWAIYRKWDREDERSYKLISRAVASEFEIFQTGRTYYY